MWKFHIHSEEASVCPVCGGALTVIGSRKRGVINTDGEKETLVIRRLRCKDCRTIHHELPDIVIPYKRHSAETVEAILGRGSAGVYWRGEYNPPNQSVVGGVQTVL